MLKALILAVFLFVNIAFASAPPVPAGCGYRSMNHAIRVFRTVDRKSTVSLNKANAVYFRKVRGIIASARNKLENIERQIERLNILASSSAVQQAFGCLAQSTTSFVGSLFGLDERDVRRNRNRCSQANIQRTVDRYLAKITALQARADQVRNRRNQALENAVGQRNFQLSQAAIFCTDAANIKMACGLMLNTSAACQNLAAAQNGVPCTVENPLACSNVV